MSVAISVEDAQAKLKELIHQLAPGDEIVITENQTPVARLIGDSVNQRPPRKAGNCVGMIRIVADDEEHLDDFGEYL